MQPMLKNEATAAKRVMYFPLVVDVDDAVTPETGEVGGQPQYSVDGGATWTNTSGVLAGGVNGAYLVQLTQAETNAGAAGNVLLGRYVSANTLEARAIPIHLVSYDPTDAGAAAVADAVLAEVVADHKATAGSLAELLHLLLQDVYGKAVVTKAANTEVILDTDGETPLKTKTYADDTTTITRTVT